MDGIKAPFATLNAINCNDHTERKNGLTYLSWAWAWGILKKHYPDSFYTVYEADGGIPYFSDGKTCWVKTGVTVVDSEGFKLEHIEYLPIMNHRNLSIPVDQVTSMDVNKAIQRSLTKAAARHGLGLYIYAGEDLPEDEAEAEAKKQKESAEKRRAERAAQAVPVKVTVNTPLDRKGLLNDAMQTIGCDVETFGRLRQTLIDSGAAINKPTKELTDVEFKEFLKAMIDNFAA